uniref:Uncharacterized protein n=1 Tax=Anopheles melas TaxID=34690 RepID=A0A182U6Q2_9DIPT
MLLPSAAGTGRSRPEPIGAVQSRSEQSELLMPSEPSEPVGAGWSRWSSLQSEQLRRLQPALSLMTAPTGSDGSDGINSSDCSDRLCTAPIGSGCRLAALDGSGWLRVRNFAPTLRNRLAE